MWTEAHKSGKVNFVERYKDPYTQKWRQTSVLMEKDTPRIRKEAQKILDAKRADILSKLKSSEMLFTDLFDQWWGFYQQEIKRSSIASLRGNIRDIRESFGIVILRLSILIPNTSRITWTTWIALGTRKNGINPCSTLLLIMQLTWTS